MGLQSIGIPGLIIILVIALVIFGPSKLPQLGRAVGQTLREFKTSTREIMDDVTEEVPDISDVELEKDRKKLSGNR